MDNITSPIEQLRKERDQISHEVKELRFHLALDRQFPVMGFWAPKGKERLDELMVWFDEVDTNLQQLHNEKEEKCKQQ